MTTVTASGTSKLLDSEAAAKESVRAATAGLAGTFKAWLSDSSTSPSTRFTKTGNTSTFSTRTTIRAQRTCREHLAVAEAARAVETGGAKAAPAPEPER